MEKNVSAYNAIKIIFLWHFISFSKACADINVKHVLNIFLKEAQ